MSIEGEIHSTEQIKDPERMRIKMMIEMSLIKRFLKNNKIDKSEEEVGAWIDKYSERFREIFQREIEANPNLWTDDPIAQTACLDYLEEELYS